MPVIKRFSRCRIEMYFGDHNPPHFHVITVDESRVAVALSDFSIIRGSAKTRDIAEALEWAKDNGSELITRWIEYTESE